MASVLFNVNVYMFNVTHLLHCEAVDVEVYVRYRMDGNWFDFAN